VTEDRLPLGYVVAIVGGISGAASLWLGWFTFTVPHAALVQVGAYAQQLGALQPYIQASIAQISQHGAFHLTAWEVMTGIPAALLVVSAIAVLVSLLALSGRASGVGRLVAWCGAIALALGAYRVVNPPGPSGVLDVGTGLYLNLAAAVATMAGGLLAHSGEANPRAAGGPSIPDPAAVLPHAVDPRWSDSRSVPPPSAR
jgi:hypothetical protein